MRIFFSQEMGHKPARLALAVFATRIAGRPFRAPKNLFANYFVEGSADIAAPTIREIFTPTPSSNGLSDAGR
jgi:hypothetical protein